MSKFTDSFSDFLDREVDSISAICKYSGVERTTIQKLKTGKRHPPLKTLETFLSYTRISASEKAELLRLYEIELIGEDIYLSRKYVRELFNKIAMLKSSPKTIPEEISDDMIHGSPGISGSKVIKGTFYVNITVLSWMQKAVNSKKSMHLFMPFSYSSFFDNLARFYYTSQDSLKIEHILNFERNTKSAEHATANLQILSKTLDFLLMKKDGYEPYYFYGSSDDITDNFTPLPYYCCTDEEVLVFGSRFESCIYSNQDDIVSFYNEHFNEIKEEARALVTKSASPNFSITNYLSAIESGLQMHLVMEAQPCFGKIITRDLVNKYLHPQLPQRDFIVDVLSKAYENVKNVDKRFYSFFSEEGLYKFASDGIISYFPPGSALPLDIPDRILFMRKIQENIATDDPLFFIVHGDRLKIADNGSCEIMDNGNIIFTLQYEDQASLLTINESSLYEAILDYFRSLKDSDSVYSKDEALKLVDDCIEFARTKA